MAETNYIDTGVTFDPDVGLYAPETADVRESIAERCRDAFHEDGKPELDTDPTTPMGQIVDSWTAEVQAKNSELLYLASMFNPKTAEGRWQDALAYFYYISRKTSEPTVVTCQLTGLYGTVVPYGAIVENADGYQLICNSPATIEETGTVETTFRTAETGAIEIPAHTVTKIVTTIPGWDTVDNEAAGATGRTLETRSEFENRRFKSVSINSHGSAESIYSAVAAVEGVIDCVVYENITDQDEYHYGVLVKGHGVGICVYGGEDVDIAEAIYRKKGTGASTTGNTTVTYNDPDYEDAEYNFQIYRPEPMNFYVQVYLVGVSTMTEDVKRQIRQAVVDDFLGTSAVSGNPRVSLGSTVKAARFYASVLDVVGPQVLEGIQIRMGDDGDFVNSVDIRADEEPVMTTDMVLLEEV